VHQKVLLINHIGALRFRAISTTNLRRASLSLWADGNLDRREFFWEMQDKLAAAINISPTAMSLAVISSLYSHRSTPLEENDMTAPYTFDVFSSLDGYGAASANWTGYWGKQGPELLDHRLAL